MLRIEKVTGKNVWEIVRLRVKEEQNRFVASNEVSIIEAYAAITGGGHAFPFGIYDGDTPVGFLMIGYDIDDYWENPPAIAKGNYSLWRLMIDEHKQHRGYGRAAVQLALQFIRTMPCGEAQYCYLSYEKDNAIAKELYHSLGFRENGEMDGEEVVAVLKL